MPKTICVACVQDRRALLDFTTRGGALPVKTCQAVHLYRCRLCKALYAALNLDGRCDPCFRKWEAATRPLRLVAEGEGVTTTPSATVNHNLTPEEIAAAVAEFNA